MHSLSLDKFSDHSDSLNEALTALGDAAIQPSLTTLKIYCTRVTTRALELLEGLAASRLTELVLNVCDFPSTCASVLARIARSSALTRLELSAAAGLFDYVTAVAAFADALRDNRTLTELSLRSMNEVRNVRGRLAMLIAAVAGHPTLQNVEVSQDLIGAQRADWDVTALDAVSAVIAANAPALAVMRATDFDVFDDTVPELPAAQLATFAVAVYRNTHMLKLRLSEPLQSIALANWNPLARLRIQGELEFD